MPIRYQFNNYLSLIETNLEINNFLISKMVSNLINIVTNYFLSLKLVFN